MGLQKARCTTTTYEFVWGFLVDVVDFEDSNILSIYLHHQYYYNIRMRMFDVDKYELNRDGGHLFEIIESELIHGPYIKDYEERFLSDKDNIAAPRKETTECADTPENPNKSKESDISDDIPF